MKTSRRPGSCGLTLEKSSLLLQRSSRFCPRPRFIWLATLLLAGFLWHPQHAAAQQTIALQQTPAAVRNGEAQLLGRYDPGQKLRLVFALRPPHMQEEEQFLQELQDRDSPLFHKYLSAEEWNNRFAPSPQDEQAVAEWASSQGLAITQRYPNRLLVDVEAPVAIIEKALDVTINQYQLGQTSVFSNDRDPSIPAPLVGIVHSVLGLNSIEVFHSFSNMKGMPDPDYSAGPAYALGEHLQGNAPGTKSAPARSGQASDAPQDSDGPAGPDNPYYNFTPQDIYSTQAYDYLALQQLGHCCNPLNNPNNSPPEASIAIAIWDDYSDADFAAFITYFPLAYNVQRYSVDGTPKCCSPEPTLDVEWATATANSFGSSSNTAAVHVYEGANGRFSTLMDVINHALGDGHARVLSMSWGTSEARTSPPNMDTAHAIFNQMVGQGWSLVAASGDNGATTDCADYYAVSYPASDPDVTAVGGTTLSTNYYGYSSETGWSGGIYGCKSNDGGSGGGCSVYFGNPAYQPTYCGYLRSVPDIALNADWVNSPQSFYFSGYLQGTGGTSIGAPEMAGFYAQENAYLLYIQSLVGNTCGATLASPCAPMGNVNYYLYDEGLNQRAPHYPFYDVTSGCNNNDITQQYGINAYCAGPGYDFVTGWGSPNMFQLAWSINNYLAGDSAGPSIAFSGPLKNHWYNTDQPISWTISDATGNGHLPNGVAGFTYYWDSDPGDPYNEPEGTYSYGYTNSFYGGPQFPYPNGAVLLSSSGALGCHTLIVRAWDNSGQASVSSYGPLCFDSFPPNTASTLLGSGQYPYYQGPVQVVLTASDYGSGVASTMYQIDNGAWQTYTTPFRIFVPGNHAVSYYSTDIAGNIEATQSTSFTITSNGTFTLTVSTSGSPGGLVSSGDGDIYCGSICSHLYYNGSYVTLTATPPQGSVFAGWTGCDSSSGNICTLSIDSDRQVTAIFNVPTPLQFVSVTPCRVADTRLANGPFGGPPINGDDYRDYVIPQSPCGIPSTASAYSLNITVVPHGPLGYLTVWPSGLTQPGISTLNSYDGRAKANAAIVPAGTGKAISVYVTDTTDVILDIDGYFTPANGSTLAFYPLTPCRVLDTRNPNGHLGGPYLQGDQERDFPVLESGCIPQGVKPQAYSMNFTVVPYNQEPLGFLTVWPQGSSRPLVSTLNNWTATAVANAAIVPAGAGGGIAAYASGDTQLVGDIDGYFAAPGQGGLSLYQVAPCRVLDTRTVGNGPPFSGELTVDVMGSLCAPLGQAQAYVLNATVVPSVPLGYLTLWPDGAGQPGVSTLNAWDGAVTSNAAIVPATNGKVDAYGSDPTQLILDISSYFAP